MKKCKRSHHFDDTNFNSLIILYRPLPVVTDVDGNGQNGKNNIIHMEKEFSNKESSNIGILNNY